MFTLLLNTQINTLERTTVQLDSGQVSETWADALSGIPARRDIAPKGFNVKDDKYKTIKELYVFYVDIKYKGLITANNRIVCESIEYYIDDIIAFDGISTGHHVEIYAHRIDLGTTAGLDVHSQALTEVIHDSTLTGKGTVDDPLSVVNVGGGIHSVNGQTADLSGNVVIDTDDINDTTLKRFVSDTEKATWNAKSDFSGAYNDLTGKPNIPDELSDLIEDSLHRTVTDAEKVTWNSKADLVAGKVPASQLPAFVDDVLEYANLAGFPVTGESDKIYVAIDTNKTYRWSGTAYVEVGSGGVALGETSSTAYRGDRGKIAYDHTFSTSNPHSVTKAQVGLGNVDNTSDINKPISTAQQSAIDERVPYHSPAHDIDFTGVILKLTQMVSDSNLEIQAITGGIYLDAINLVLRATSQFGVSNNGGSNIAYLDTSNMTADRNWAFPDTDGLGVLSLNGVTADNEGNIEYPIQAPIVDFAGIENVLYKPFFEKNMAYMFPTEGATTYNNAFKVRGPTTLSGAAATTDGAPAIDFTTSAVAGNVALQRASSLVCQSIFTLVRRFELKTFFTDTRFFIGTSNQFLLSAPTNVEPDTLINMIGVGKLSTSQNLHVIHNDGSGLATVFDLGSDFTLSTLYEYSTITVKTQSGFTMYIQRKEKSTGATLVTSYSATTNFPISSSQSTFHYITNNGTASAVVLRDFGPHALEREE